MPEETEEKPEEEEGENPSSGKDVMETINPPSAQALLGPEGCLMIFLAISLDIFGLVDFIPVIGNILSYIPDVLGLLIIGGWQIHRSQTIRVTHRRAAARAGGIAQKAKKLKWIKWLKPIFFVAEFIPFIGTLPCWTLVVWFELKN
ncbi:hypothetical protein KKB68_01090 [Patescibacteria group bacterium]|nr:hypothetical protein [Patescibacteria group bacterium]